MRKHVLNLLCCFLGLAIQATATANNNSFIEAITLDKRKEIKIETHGEVITYDTAFDVPVTLDAVDSYAQKHQLSISLKTYKRQGGGSGCGHSPACVILLPFAIVDLYSSETVSVVTFSDKQSQLFHAKYEPPLNLLSKLETEPVFTPDFTIETSKALNRIYISHFDETERTRVINQLYQALPKFNDMNRLSAFKSDVLNIAWHDNNNWGTSAFLGAKRELEKTTIYNAKQKTAIATLACDIAKKYELYESQPSANWLSTGGKKSLLSSSTDIKSLSASQAILECIANEKNFSAAQLKQIENLLKVQIQSFCDDSAISDYGWHRHIDDFYSEYLPLAPLSSFECDSRLFQVYQRWYQEQSITQSDYEFLAKVHNIKSADVREKMAISDPSVLAARLVLSTDKTYDALRVLKEIKKLRPTLDQHISQLLAHLYGINLYKVDSMALLPASDDDIDKQAEILSLLASLPDTTKKQIKTVALSEPYSQAAWDIVINNKTPADVIPLLLKKEASKTKINTAFRVSDQVNEQGKPRYADLVWLALNLNPTLGEQIIEQYKIALEQKKANEPSWLEKSKSLLSTVEQKISTEL
ncbi:hypothetical protein [Motilimonas sp. E26]|uniref:hypothetical protein n=1 Tax=Motilimonas sp. E26 TaxID=2865674 RepID=UPI001E51FD64|nr:hypothetical protein [Motilimonas sp. E26]MCE0557147.1 hypothetical protein [Motilimonas sp. E26]